MAKRKGKRMRTVHDETIEKYQGDKFLDQVNAAYAALKKDPDAWKEELAERSLWDKTLADGLINQRLPAAEPWRSPSARRGFADR